MARFIVAVLVAAGLGAGCCAQRSAGPRSRNAMSRADTVTPAKTALRDKNRRTPARADTVTPAKTTLRDQDRRSPSAPVRGSVIVAFRGLDQNDLAIHDRYTIRLNDAAAIDFDEGTPATSEGDRGECWDTYTFTFRAPQLVSGENLLEITLLPSGVEDPTRDSHLNFDWFRITTGDGAVLADFGVPDHSHREFDTDRYEPVASHAALVDLASGARIENAAFPAHLQGPNYGSGKNGAARGPDDTGYYLSLRVRFVYPGP